MLTAAAPRDPPREVRWAGLALWTVATLYAISGVLTLLTRDTRTDEVSRSTTLTAAEVDQSVTLSIVISVVFALAIAAVAVLSAVNLLKGRRWARITGTVVAALTAAFALLRIVAGDPTAALNIVVLVTALAAIGLLYRRPVSTYLSRTAAGLAGER